jgi:hypothetical protein
MLKSASECVPRCEGVHCHEGKYPGFIFELGTGGVLQVSVSAAPEGQTVCDRVCDPKVASI